jgi:hypothetical protein
MPPPMYGAPPAKPQTMMPMIAGIMMIVSAIVGIAFWAYVAFIASAMVGFLPVGGGAFTTIIAICGAIFIVLGIIELLGGIMALRRKMWALALVGSILGLFTFGFYGISSILSLVALIILAISRKEF